MHIEIHSSELKTLIERFMVEGDFADTEDALLYALRVASSQPFTPMQAGSGIKRKRTLDEVFAKVRGLADDLDFSRDSSLGRAVDLS